MLTRQHALDTIAVYIEAWRTQDPDLIVTIFTEDATYHERMLAAPIPDRNAIRGYWEAKVVQDQANIECDLIHLWIDSEHDVAVAEWEARFDDLCKGERKRMRETAILEFSPSGKIRRLRETWASEVIGVLEQC